MSNTAIDNPKRPQFGQRYLEDANRVFEHNAWDDVTWTEQQLQEAERKVRENGQVTLDDQLQKRYEEEASKFWDSFYDIHQNRFFKDRHWLFVEFPEFLPGNAVGISSPEEIPSMTEDDFPGFSARKRILEIGCGVGNTVFPILETNKNESIFVYCCDFSEKAVRLLKEHSEYDTAKSLAFVLDVSSDTWDTPFPLNSLDIIIFVFVLSAIHPDKMQRVVKNAASYLKSGGMIVFRDYGRYDMAQLRFKPGRCLGENFYVRGDGTRVYFFTQEEVSKLFKEAGLVEELNHIDRRLQVNRGKMMTMYRVWIQGKFRKPVL